MSLCKYVCVRTHTLTHTYLIINESINKHFFKKKRKLPRMVVHTPLIPVLGELERDSQDSSPASVCLPNIGPLPTGQESRSPESLSLSTCIPRCCRHPLKMMMTMTWIFLQKGTVQERFGMVKKVETRTGLSPCRRAEHQVELVKCA